MARHVRVPIVGRALSPVGNDFVNVEALGGPVLLVATLAALTWANAAGASYDDLWTRHLTLGTESFGLSQDLRHWINDGLVTIFFFVVGLEIKRELVHGELRDRRTASLPVLAALGGMIVPALLYTAINAGGAGSRGWAIPMATDIAFAVVVMAVLGSRVSRPLKLFLLTLAIADDIGAILVIAFFYSEHLALGWLAGAVGVVLTIVVMQRVRIGNPLFYTVPAAVLWVCTQRSGVHATIAGVVLGLLTPARAFGGREVIEVLERRLHPWSSLLVIPVFAVANAGVHLDATAISEAARSPITWGVMAGLVIGKPLGIVGATAAGLRLRIGRLPEGLSMRHILGAGCVAGIGFTVSLFVADLSFGGAQLRDAKVGIVAASLASGAIGGLLLWSIRPPSETARHNRSEDDSTVTWESEGQ